MMSKSKEIVKEAPTKAPIKSEKITLDDFVLTVDGDDFYPHKGEYVEIIPIRQLSALRNLMKLAAFSTGDDAISTANSAILDQYDNLTQIGRAHV